MTGSVALDVVIGLVFVYLLYSLLVTIVQEWIASMLSFRAKFLEKAIIRMLEDGDPKAPGNPFSNFFGIFRLFFPTSIPANNAVAKAFYDHPLIKYLAEDNYNKRPSYLTAKNFSKTLVDLLRGNQVRPSDDVKQLIEDALHVQETLQWNQNPAGDKPRINPQTLDFLKSLWADSQGDVSKFTASLEEWFDTTMERVTGWYKKHTQALLLIIGLLIAVTFNVDTIQIARNLANSPALRAETIKQADAWVKKNPNGMEKDSLPIQIKNQLQSDLKGLPPTLGAGWTKADFQSFDAFRNAIGNGLVGWLLTAFALSLGAPFWFDLLNKLMKVRASVSSAGSSGSAPPPFTSGTRSGSPNQTVG